MNRLSREKSPYLLQHATNPVDWYPWGEEAFEKAKKEDKPVFLSIGYSTCHWCHVMAHESFENEATAKFLNDHFVSIKVDREERSDLDSVYMSYVQAVSGSGGWPMSVFLTPDKKPFYGGTYFPPKDRWGMPGFPTLLASIAASWKERRKEILESAESAVKLFSQPMSGEKRRGNKMSFETLDTAFRRFEEGFDETWGGFGRAPKFPRSHVLSFLLRNWLRTKNPSALNIVESTLEAMSDGGLYDQLGGGFHRYSTDARWRIPHFEKMLYDQALLAQTYLDAFQVTGKKEYARIARETLDYVLDRLTGPEGGFYTAEDADSADPREPAKKKEGAYYVWEKSEIEKALGADAAVFCSYYGIQDNGNAIADPHNEFVGQNVLYRAKASEDEATRLNLERGRATLLRLRRTRPAPHRDDKVLTDWNGLMIAAFARASVVLHEERYREAAEKAALFIQRVMKDRSGNLLHRYRDGEAAIPATLNDYAFLLEAYLSLYEATFDPDWIDRARRTADVMITRFWDGEQGGFYLTASDAEVLISRPKEIYDGAIPSGNSAAAVALQRLTGFTGESRYASFAGQTLESFSENIAADPSSYPVMLAALDLALGPAREIVIAVPKREAAEDLLNEVRKPFFPNQVVLVSVSGAGAEKLAKTAPFVADKKPVSGRAAAYVCRDHACRLPVTDKKTLKEMLQ